MVDQSTEPVTTEEARFAAALRAWSDPMAAPFDALAVARSARLAQGSHWTAALRSYLPQRGVLALMAGAMLLLAAIVALTVGGQFLRTEDPVGFMPSRSMHWARASAKATLLADGRVLVTGGWASTVGILDTAEVFDPAMGSFTPTGRMGSSRSGHAAVLLPDGRVMVAGGTADRRLYDIYDPTTGMFDDWDAPVGVSFTGATLTNLDDGRVLVAGPDSSAVFDPGSWTFERVGSMRTPREGHTATLLSDGRVLIAGGSGDVPLAGAEVFDPVAKAFEPIASMSVARTGHAAIRLPDGRVLIVGGTYDGVLPHGWATATAEVFDPTADTFASVGSTSTARVQPGLSLVPDGRVLMVGGTGTVEMVKNGATMGRPMLEALASAEWFDPVDGTFAPGPTLTAARNGPMVVALRDGTVLVVGGSGPFDDFETLNSTPLDSSEVCDPACTRAMPDASATSVEAAASAGPCEGGLRPASQSDVPAPQPSGGPSRGVLAYVTQEPLGRKDLWVAGGADQAPRRLGSTSGYLDLQGWTSDGSSLLVSSGHFSKGSRTQQHNCSVLLLVPADGTDVRVLTDGAIGGPFTDALAWSPDGASVAYEASPQGRRGLLVRDLARDERLIDAAPCEATGANADRLLWSPDGRYLAVRCEGSARAYDVASGTFTELALVSRDHGPATIGWLPGGHTLLVASFESRLGTLGEGLLIQGLDAATGDIGRISEVDVRDVEWVDPFPAGSVSPDGAHILAMAVRSGQMTYAPTRRVVDVMSGTDTLLLGPSVDAESATWTSDGTGVIYLTHGLTRSLWLVTPDGSDRERLWTLPQGTSVYAWRP